MTFSNHPGDLTAIALSFAAVLETYQQHIEKLGTDWLNRPLYWKVTAQLDELSALLGALPQLAGDMSEVIVCHVKLLHLLQAQAASGDVSRLQLRQSDAVKTLRQKTLKILAEPVGQPLNCHRYFLPQVFPATARRAHRTMPTVSRAARGP